MVAATSPSPFQSQILAGIPASLPSMPTFDPAVNRAHARALNLKDPEMALAVRNALRYHPQENHATLAPEFAGELKQYGRIYQHRFRPHYEMYARPIDEYPGETVGVERSST